MPDVVLPPPTTGVSVEQVGGALENVATAIQLIIGSLVAELAHQGLVSPERLADMIDGAIADAVRDAPEAHRLVPQITAPAVAAIRAFQGLVPEESRNASPVVKD